MKQKDLAEEYLDRKIKQEPFKSLTTDFEFAFSANDIKAAFNAGRESVMENIPELEWERVKDGSLVAETVFGKYIIRGKDEYNFGMQEYTVWSFFGLFKSTIHEYEARQAANEDYKQRIKQVLGL